MNEISSVLLLRQCKDYSAAIWMSTWMGPSDPKAGKPDATNIQPIQPIQGRGI